MSKNDYTQNSQKNKLKILNNPEIIQGINLLAHKRAEARFNGLLPYHPQLISHSLPKPPTEAIINHQVSPQDEIKIYPVILLLANKTKQGLAARLWFTARKLDQDGSGWIYRSDFDKYILRFIQDRQRRRGLTAAIRSGLLIPGYKNNRPVYRITSLANAAAIIGVNQIGLPALIDTSKLFAAGHRSNIWAAYLSTTKNRPISQDKKAAITGIDKRTQYNYQSKLAGLKIRKNYVKTRLSGDHLTGIRDHGKQSAFIGTDKKIYYRLPDQTEVPVSTARLAHKGRSRKAQERINSCGYAARLKDNRLRLFHTSFDGVNSVIHKLARSNKPIFDQPRELFNLYYAGHKSNLWLSIAVNPEVLI